jgi:hypothetical protein
MTTPPIEEEAHHALVSAAWHKAKWRRIPKTGNYVLEWERRGSTATDLTIERWELKDWIEPAGFWLGETNVQFVRMESPVHFYMQSIHAPLPDSVESVRDIYPADRVCLYNHQGKRIREWQKQFLVRLPESECQLRLEVDFLPLGFLEPIRETYFISGYKHTPDDFIVLEATREGGKPIRFSRWPENMSDEAIDVDRYPDDEIIGCHYVCIRNGMNQILLEGNRLIIFKPRTYPKPITTQNSRLI